MTEADGPTGPDPGDVPDGPWATPETAAVERAFAAPMRHAGVRLPAAACRRRADGQLIGGGWTVRWRWHGDALEYHAEERTTGESWIELAPDGTRTIRTVPGEGFVVGDLDARERYEAAWQAHRDALAAADMDFTSADGSRPPVPAPPRERDQLSWTLDEDPDWRTVTLTPYG